MAQKNLMDSLAAMPGSPRSPKTNWGKIYDLIGERLPLAHETLNQLRIERRDVQKNIDNLACKLADAPHEPRFCFEVVISAKADASLTGELTIRYQMAAAGWQPLYDARLETEPDEGEQLVDLVRRASITQNTGEPWEDVALTLSTTRPSGGTAALDLAAKIIDILPDHPPAPLRMATAGMLRKSSPGKETTEAAFDDEVHSMPEANMMRAALEEESQVEQSGFQARFNVAGRVCLEGNGVEKKVRLGGQKLAVNLLIRSTPLLDPTAYLHANFELTEEPALLPGKVALYRDNVYVGNGQLPLVNVGEHNELGFGADDQMIIKRIELKRTKGSHGLIKTENTDEFTFQITVHNHHKQMMPVRIVDRIPASNNEKLKVERLKDMSEPTHENLDDKRGVLAYEFDLLAGDENEINIHYRLSWPKDERIG